MLICHGIYFPYGYALALSKLILLNALPPAHNIMPCMFCMLLRCVNGDNEVVLSLLCLLPLAALTCTYQ